MSDNLANPAPLGLMGFGMTTVLLNIHNAGFFPVSAVILAMGIFYGGITQMMAGCMEFKKGNTFDDRLHFLRRLLVNPCVLIYFNGQFDIPKNEKGFMACYLLCGVCLHFFCGSAHGRQMGHFRLFFFR